MPSRLARIVALGTAARSVTVELKALQSTAEGVEKTLGALADSKGGAGAVDQVRGAVQQASAQLQNQLHSTTLVLQNGSKALLETGGDLLTQIMQMVGTLSNVAGTNLGVVNGPPIPGGAGGAVGQPYPGGAGGGSPSPGYGGGSGPPPVGGFPQPGTLGANSTGLTLPAGTGGNGGVVGQGRVGTDNFSTFGFPLPPLPELFGAIQAGVLDFTTFLNFAASQHIPNAVNEIANAVSRLDPREYTQRLFEIRKALEEGKLSIEEVLKFLDGLPNQTAKYFANLIEQFRQGNLSLAVLRQQLDQLATSTLKGTTFEDLIKALADEALQQGNR